MLGVKKHRVVPRPEGVIGIRDSGDGHTPVTTRLVEWWWWCRGGCTQDPKSLKIRGVCLA